jgi:protoporphyrinogen oxidase
VKGVVIGSGFAGLAASDRLHRAGVEVEVCEARDTWGGHTCSVETDGFTFDEGPHVSFTADDQVREVFRRGAGEVRELKARITNWFGGYWVPHPAQCHLYGLDPGLVTACIVDFANSNRDAEVNDYAEWCRTRFGRTFAESFPLRYTRKYWTVEANELGVDWIGSRVYSPGLEEVVRGALEPSNEGDFHYLSEVRYPARGGYQSFMREMLHEELVHTSKRVVKVDPSQRRLTFADGGETGYDKLVSTMPLPELALAVPDSPTDVREAARALLCTSLVLVDVAVARDRLFDHEWFYVYDEDISFSRASFPHMLSSANAPAGKGSIQVEVYHSRGRPLPCAPESLPQRVVDELVGMGILHDRDEVLWARHREVPYANVVFDHRRAQALDVLLPWARSLGIHLAGRYAEWGYHWTDDATRSGWRAATSILRELG